MTQYAVYALGNALVDLEYTATEDDLAQLRIDKGVMTLVDEQQQARIMEHFKHQQPRRGSGGSAANSIIALAQLGGQGFYSCKVADDTLGRFYIDDLQAAGVATSADQHLATGNTGRCVVLVTPDTDRTMCTYLGVSSDLSPEALDHQALRQSQYFYTEGYLVTSPTALQAAIEARQIAEQAGVKTALSLSDPNMVNFFKDGLRELIGEQIDLVFANEEEARGMADAASLNEAADYLKTIARQFAITRGPHGALIYDGNELIEIAPVKVTAVDTVGAGDMFAGAFLYGLTQGWDHRRAGALASAASAKLVTSLGPRLTQDMTQTILREVTATFNAI